MNVINSIPGGICKDGKDCGKCRKCMVNLMIKKGVIGLEGGESRVDLPCQLILDCRVGADGQDPIIGCYQDTVKGLELAKKELVKFLSYAIYAYDACPDDIILNNGIIRIPIHSILSINSNIIYYYSGAQCTADNAEVQRLYDEKVEERAQENEEEDKQRQERKKKRKARRQE